MLVLGCAGSALAATASAAGIIYWGNWKSSTIGYASLDGSGGGQLETAGASVNEPLGVALDPATGLIYWQNSSGSIDYADLGGNGGGQLDGTTPVALPEGLAIDPDAGLLYWSSAFENKILYASLNGGGGGVLDTGSAPVEFPSGVMVDPATGRIYWTNLDSNTIGYANLDGSGGGALDTDGAPIANPEGLAADPETGRIYWANSSDTIGYANLDDTGEGGELDTTGAPLASPYGIAVDPAAGRVYWTNETGNAIGYANADGTAGGGQLETTGATLDVPTLPAILQPPVGEVAPSVQSSGSQIGATLSCSQGAWAPNLPEAFDYRAPQSIAYAWTLNGAPIAGASASSIIASAAGSYNCQVTATNHAGASSQTSAALAIAASPPAPPPTPTPTPAPAVVAPAITGLKVSPRRLRAALHGASIIATKTGAIVSYAIVSYEDSEAATTKFTVIREVRGFKHGRSCVAKRPSGERKHKPKRCVRHNAVGSFSHVDIAGHNRFAFSGRIHGHKLKPGSYHLDVRPALDGLRGAIRSAAFKIVR